MNTEAKGQVIARIFTVNNQFFSTLKHVFISIAREIPHQQLIAGLNLLAADNAIVVRRATHVGERRLPANDFGHHIWNQRVIVLQLFKF